MNAGLGAIAPRNPNPMAPQPQPFQQLLDLNKAVKAANLQRAAQGQQAMAQAAQRPPTVKEELEMALRQAMPQQPVYAAKGGEMRVQDSEGELTEADLEGLDEDLMAEGLFDRPLGDYVIEFLGGNVPQARERPGARERAEARGPSAPTRELELTNLEKPLFDMALDRLSGRSSPPINMRAEYPEPRAVRESRPPAGLAAAAATPSAGPAPAARPAGAGTARPAGAAGLGAVAPEYDAMTQMRRMSEQLAKDVEGTAAVDPRVLEARQAYDSVLKASMDPAEQQLRDLEAQQSQNFFENPELMAAMLEGMKGSERLGETLFGAATGLVKARAGQKRERREAQANIIKLRQELAKAEAEARLARVEGDVKREQAAKLKAAEIRVAVNEKAAELEIKETTANAAAAAAANRGANAEEKLSFQKDSAIRKAIADVQNKNPIPAGIKGPARQRLIDAQIEKILQQLSVHGVTREQVLGYFSTPGQATAAPGATLSAEDRALIERYTAPK